MNELIEDVRKGMLQLIAQIKVPPDQYKDDSVIPIVWNLKKSLQSLKTFQASDSNLAAFNNSAMELIPIVVALLRNKSQGLDFSADEDRLKVAIKSFQGELQKINNPTAPSPGRSRDRDTGSDRGSGNDPLAPQRRATVAGPGEKAPFAGMSVSSSALPVTRGAATSSPTASAASPQGTRSRLLTKNVSDDNVIVTKRVVADVAGPVARGPMIVTGGSRSPASPPVPAPALSLAQAARSPIAAVMVRPDAHNTSPARAGSERALGAHKMPNIMIPNRPGTSGPLDAKRNSGNKSAVPRDPSLEELLHAAPIPSLIAVPNEVHYGEALSRPAPVIYKEERSPSLVFESKRPPTPTGTPLSPRAQSVDDEDDYNWDDWDFDETEPAQDSDDEGPDNFVDSMSSFEEFYSSRASGLAPAGGPRTLAELQAAVNKSHPVQPSTTHHAGTHNRPPGAPPSLVASFAPSSPTPSTWMPVRPGPSASSAPEYAPVEHSEPDNLHSLAARGAQQGGYLGFDEDNISPRSAFGGPVRPPAPSQNEIETRRANQDLTAAQKRLGEDVGPVFAPVQREGWLLKLSPNKTLGTRFQRRYFILHGQLVRYYNNPPGTGGSNKPLGDVLITNTTTIYRLSGPESLAKTGYLQSENGFELRADYDGFGRTFLLVAPTMAEKKEWCDAMTMAKVNSQGSSGQQNIMLYQDALKKRSSQKGSSVDKIKKAARKDSKKF